jgi:hypothetical protein
MEADMPRISPRIPLRIPLATAAIAGTALLLSAVDSRAEYSAYGVGRYCAVSSNGNGSVKEICNFNDFESCRREVVSGNRGWCNDNPRFSPQWGARAAEWQPAAHRSKRKHRPR